MYVENKRLYPLLLKKNQGSYLDWIIITQHWERNSFMRFRTHLGVNHHKYKAHTGE